MELLVDGMAVTVGFTTTVVVEIRAPKESCQHFCHHIRWEFWNLHPTPAH